MSVPPVTYILTARLVAGYNEHTAAVTAHGLQSCDCNRPVRAPPINRFAMSAGSQVYGGVDWVATAISADETAGGADCRPSQHCCASCSPWQKYFLHNRLTDNYADTKPGGK